MPRKRARIPAYGAQARENSSSLRKWEGVTMRRVAWASLAVGLLAFVWLASSAAQEKPAKPTAKWEYKTLTQTELDKAKGLSQLGDEGWELVAVEPELREPFMVNLKANGMIMDRLKQQRTYYFKRPK
jgi:hypothetical protein